jgi:16S rRNA (guanine966-N2)-methyltransferase
VLDLFAGSGALGLEALSRVAANATFVESDRDACRVINANLDKLGFRAIVLCQDVLRAVANERRRFDLVLCDPPYEYDRTRLDPELARLVSPDGVVVLETAGREDAPDLPGLRQRTSRRYGAARLTLFEL